MSATPPSAAEFTALAHEALLAHLNRGDARQALHNLCARLQARLGQRCSLTALDAGGGVRWTEGTAETEAAAWPALVLQRLGRTVGWLRVQGGQAAPGAAWHPLLTTLAALLLQDADSAGSADSRGLAPVAMLRAALAGAGTFVWEWELDSDSLGDIDEGLEQLGYAPGEIGRTQGDWDALIHPDDRDANHQAYLRHARNEVDIYEHAYRARAADGRWRWLQERGRIVEHHADGTPRRMLGTQTDITDRLAAEQAVSEARARLEKIAHHAPGMLYQFERRPDGVASFKYVSAGIQDLFGLMPEQAMADASLVFAAIAPEDRLAALASVSESARLLGEWRQEFRVPRPDGGVRWLLGSSTPQREADGSVVWHGTVTDISDQHELETARQATAVAEAANRAKTGFLSRMSHELRTPLNAVLGFTQLMEADLAEPPTATQRRRLALVREAGEHLLQMIGDLLDLTRIESGGMSLQLASTPLLPLAQECLAMLQGAATQAGVTMSISVPTAGEPLAALADRTRLRQVLLNLLSNAIKYNRPGGQAELRLAPAAGGTVQLALRDTGIGIGSADLPHLFEPFYRGAQERGRVDGAGIGLSVTQALVALMDGQIAVQSEPGQGSMFTVTLPAA